MITTINLLSFNLCLKNKNNVTIIGITISIINVSYL